MNKGRMDMTHPVFRGFVFATCLTFLFTLSLADVSVAKTAGEIDSEVNEALNLFSKQVKDAKEFLNTAKAVLVIPKIVKAGLGVGGQ
jgi:lipid-binding SYLF domain-containing protein